jgi:ribosomal protein S18 acetylase RimI-like enzyme
MSKYQIRTIASSDEELVVKLLQEHWGAREVVSRGRVLDAAKLPGFFAQEGSKIVGLITLHFDGLGCEVVTLDAFMSGKGIGSSLITQAESAAKKRGCKKLWLITSNDNLGALTFYQKIGFRIVAVHRDAIIEARKLKPQIPLVAENGIPITDEIELEKQISNAG